MADKRGRPTGDTTVSKEPHGQLGRPRRGVRSRSCSPPGSRNQPQYTRPSIPIARNL